MRQNVHDLDTALADEFAAIHGPDPPVANQADLRRHAAEVGQSALCLSGGGVRSAAFSLGVVQALARAGLLARFHYLSTVSGGGFIGSWLSMLIDEAGGARAAETDLREHEAAPAIRALREYTDYLSPTGGLFSTDTWTGIVLYLRNLLISGLAFAPIFLLAVLATIFYRTALWRVGEFLPLYGAALVIGAACVFVATLRGCLDLPSHRPPRPGTAAPQFTTTATITHWIVWPMLVWAFLVPATLSGWLEPAPLDVYKQFWLPLIYAVAMVAGYWGAAIMGRAPKLYWDNFGAWLMATAFSAVLLWLGLRLAQFVPQDEQAEALAVVGPLWLVLADVLQVTVHLSMRREALFGDLDREWLARLSAVKLQAIVVWTAFAFCCLSLQRLAFHIPGTHWPYWAVPLITLVSGPTAAWLGKQAFASFQTAVSSEGGLVTLQRLGLPLLAVVFGIGLFAVLGFLAGEALGFLQTRVAENLLGLPTDDRSVPLAVQIVAMAVLGLVLWKLVKQINVNRFSMHGVYRNRLTRAFLGAARRTRAPDPFTGFDPDDNPRMVQLLPRQGPSRLFHVVNVTLNLTATTRTAWSERKAAAFTITPLACGSAVLWEPNTPSDNPGGCFVPSGRYAGSETQTGKDDEPKGISLASAMTISGAALSPNWGYHSSPITAFLMTLFNVRLGAWLPNPAVVTNPGELSLAWPHQSLLPMLSDLLGRTTDTAKAIYLSDGGHFDNLGLYEMLRRRCRLILVVDAGEDFACTFADLGDSIRKSTIDQQIHVNFDDGLRISSRGTPGTGAARIRDSDDRLSRRRSAGDAALRKAVLSRRHPRGRARLWRRASAVSARIDHGPMVHGKPVRELPGPRRLPDDKALPPAASRREPRGTARCGPAGTNPRRTARISDLRFCLKRPCMHSIVALAIDTWTD